MTLRPVPTRMGGVAVLAAAFALSACTLFGEDEPPPPCPEIAVLQDAASMTKFVEGPGRDLIDVVVEGKIVDAQGVCEYDIDDDTGAGTLTVEMVVSVQLNRGPANRNREANFGYFVAITDPERNILNKETFTATVPFPGNRNRLIWTDEPVYMGIPLKANQTGKNFRIFLGLDVDRDQLRFNRQQIQDRQGRPTSGG